MQIKKNGLVIAGAAAALLASGFAANSVFANEGKHHKNSVHCGGVNSCKGQSECKSKDNACKGQNSCKGKGWTSMSAEECKKQGGTVEMKEEHNKKEKQ